MALPQNITPVYTCIVPSTGKSFKFRQFLVKNEKALLIAQESEDLAVMIDTFKDVIADCAKSEIDVDKLSTTDIEAILLQMRIRSVGEFSEIVLNCNTCEDSSAHATVQVDLREVKTIKDPEHVVKFNLFNNVGICMKYPTAETIKRAEDAEDELDIIIDCIDYIYDEEQIYSSKDQTKAELAAFLDNLLPDQFEKIQRFFQTLPSLRLEVAFTCPVCKVEQTKHLEGLLSFF